MGGSGDEDDDGNLSDAERSMASFKINRGKRDSDGGHAEGKRTADAEGGGRSGRTKEVPPAKELPPDPCGTCHEDMNKPDPADLKLELLGLLTRAVLPRKRPPQKLRLKHICFYCYWWWEKFHKGLMRKAFEEKCETNQAELAVFTSDTVDALVAKGESGSMHDKDWDKVCTPKERVERFNLTKAQATSNKPDWVPYAEWVKKNPTREKPTWEPSKIDGAKLYKHKGVLGVATPLRMDGGVELAIIDEDETKHIGTAEDEDTVQVGEDQTQRTQSQEADLIRESLAGTAQPNTDEPVNVPASTSTKQSPAPSGSSSSGHASGAGQGQGGYTSQPSSSSGVRNTRQPDSPSVSVREPGSGSGGNANQKREKLTTSGLKLAEQAMAKAKTVVDLFGQCGGCDAVTLGPFDERMQKLLGKMDQGQTKATTAFEKKKKDIRVAPGKQPTYELSPDMQDYDEKVVILGAIIKEGRVCLTAMELDLRLEAAVKTAIILRIKMPTIVRQCVFLEKCRLAFFQKRYIDLAGTLVFPDNLAKEEHNCHYAAMTHISSTS